MSRSSAAPKKTQGACPVCGYAFIAWRWLSAGQWRCIKCPDCNAALMPKWGVVGWTFGLLFLMLVGPGILMLFAFETPGPLMAIILLGAFTVFWAVGAFFVPLVPCGKWMGVWGYDAYSDDGGVTYGDEAAANDRRNYAATLSLVSGMVSVFGFLELAIAGLALGLHSVRSRRRLQAFIGIGLSVVSIGVMLLAA